MKTPDFALAPSGATHYMSSRWVALYAEAWLDCESLEELTSTKGAIEIPPREIELNRLVDLGWSEAHWDENYQWGWLRGDQLFTSNNPFYDDTECVFDRSEFVTRLNRRREAGLIHESAQPDDGVAEALDEMARLNQETGQYDIDHNPLIKERSSACSQCGALVSEQVVKPEQSSDEWVDGLPPEGVECYMANAHGEFIVVDIIANKDGYAVGWAKKPRSMYERVFYSNDPNEFRPIETEQQKAERELKQLKEKIYAGHIAPGKPKMREEMVSDIVDILCNGLSGYRLVKEDTDHE